ncbi:hypothetical protein C8F01DRAFT_750579 [Mycena amicta]|nr:hypothetical protein C8F01DRAFT_750579 [Mycena amicta]
MPSYSTSGYTHSVLPSVSQAEMLAALAIHNSTAIHRVLNAHRTWSRESLEQAYPGFPFGTFELSTLGVPLRTADGQNVLSIKLKWKICTDEDYWTVRFDGAKIAAFSVPRKTMNRLKDFTIDGPIVVQALQCSFQAGGERVELEVGKKTEAFYVDRTTPVEIVTSFPASPLLVRVYHDSADGKTSSPSATQYWPVGFHQCGASRCNGVFADGAYCERHRPFGRRG